MYAQLDKGLEDGEREGGERQRDGVRSGQGRSGSCWE